MQALCDGGGVHEVTMAQDANQVRVHLSQLNSVTLHCLQKNKTKLLRNTLHEIYTTGM